MYPLVSTSVRMCYDFEFAVRITAEFNVVSRAQLKTNWILKRLGSLSQGVTCLNGFHRLYERSLRTVGVSTTLAEILFRVK